MLLAAYVYRAEYDRLKTLKEKADENIIFSFQKKKGITAERKQVKEQKEEAEKFAEKREEQSSVLQDFFLFQLFHIEVDIKDHEDQINILRDEIEVVSNRESVCTIILKFCS